MKHSASRSIPPENAPSVSVLYFQHVGSFGGSSRSLLELVSGFPQGAVIARVVTKRGDAAAFFMRAGMEVAEVPGLSQFDNTRWGHYRGSRWLILLRELWFLPATAIAVLRARQRWPDTQIVHVNESVQLATVIMAKAFFRRPVVVHVRSVQDLRHSRLRSRLFAWVLRCYADSLIAIDETVRCSLPPGVAAEVVHNAHSPRSDGTGASLADLPLPPRTPGVLRVAMVGSPLAFKGANEFVEAARLCRERNLPVKFLIVGVRASESRGLLTRLLRATGLLHDAGEDVRRYIAEYGLSDSVHLLGFTPNIDQVYRNIDVLCFPSHLDAVGRPVIEAAFWRVPSIVAMRHPKPDTMIHRKTGLCIERGDARAIADAVSYFCLNPSETSRMGEAAHRLALDNFDSEKNAARVLGIYLRALAAGGPTRATL